jgi:5-methylthioribose kinase
MNILSEYSAEEQFLSLLANNYSSVYPAFFDLLKKHVSTLRTTSVISAKRNIIFEFVLNKEYYILKHFLDKKQSKKWDLLEENNYEQILSGSFEKEEAVLKYDLLFLPKLCFTHKQSRMIVMKKLNGYKELDNLIRGGRFLGDTSDRKDYLYYLKTLALTIKAFQKIENSDLSQGNANQILMVGELKKNDQLFENYKLYCGYWKADSIIHADLFSRNILVNKKTKDIKIIDWEMTTVGDVYFDLSIVISMICNWRLGTSFTDVHYSVEERPFDYRMLKKDIQHFLDTYDKDIDRQKLKVFLIINTQHLSNKVENLIKNIDQIFS